MKVEFFSLLFKKKRLKNTTLEKIFEFERERVKKIA